MLLLTTIIIVICLLLPVLSRLSFAQQKQIQRLNWTDHDRQFTIQVPSYDGDFQANHNDDIIKDRGGWVTQNGSLPKSFADVIITNYDNGNSIFMAFGVLSFDELKNISKHSPIPIPEKYIIPKKFVNYSIDNIILDAKFKSPDFELIERSNEKYSIGNYSSSSIMLKINDRLEPKELDGQLYVYSVDVDREKVLQFYYSADADVFISRLPLAEKKFFLPSNS